MSSNEGFSTYRFDTAQRAHAHNYLLPTLDAQLSKFAPRSVFDLGCGNGSVANHLSKLYQVVGIDYSTSGIAQANLAYPGLKLEVGSAYDDLAAKYGQFDAVISLEVVEHLFMPRVYAKRMFDLVKPGGGIIVSTPYHGYWKNLALALTGSFDRHFTVLWDGGHIKFWSIRTLSTLLEEAGFINLRFTRIGRIAPVARGMVVVAWRPSA